MAVSHVGSAFLVFSVLFTLLRGIGWKSGVSSMPFSVFPRKWSWVFMTSCYFTTDGQVSMLSMFIDTMGHDHHSWSLRPLAAEHVQRCSMLVQMKLRKWSQNRGTQSLIFEIRHNMNAHTYPQVFMSLSSLTMKTWILVSSFSSCHCEDIEFSMTSLQVYARRLMLTYYVLHRILFIPSFPWMSKLTKPHTDLYIFLCPVGWAHHCASISTTVVLMKSVALDTALHVKKTFCFTKQGHKPHFKLGLIMWGL